MDKDIEKVAANIRKIRIAKKLSILKLATKAGISHSHLYYIETNQTSPTVDTLSKLAQALDVRMKDFFE